MLTYTIFGNIDEYKDGKIFKEITLAYETLSDQTKKSSYDESTIFVDSIRRYSGIINLTLSIILVCI